FHIKIRNENTNQSIPSPFDQMRLLRGVKEHYQYRLNRGSDDKYSLFIHRRDLCIFALCVACGLRRSEIHKMEIHDVDFDKETIRIAGKGSGMFTTRERLAFFSHPFLQEILRNYWFMRNQLPGTFFFCNWLGDGVSATTIDAIFGAYNSFLHHTPPYNPTGLRKTFCTHLVQKKVSLGAIQQLMGHEKCDTTLTYYVQLSPELN
ncbi:MAG: site-specific integrase, partial [SAR324 cluster bacterium]|nr:site-specific integrase [SAR324 cluster bacterium]